MTRNNNNGKRHKNQAGHKASKYRKNSKGNKATNHSNKHHGRGRAIRGTSEGWYAVAAMQGRRSYMEDVYHVLIPDATCPAAGDLHSLFGVFDGHGGKKVALCLKEKLLPAIVAAYAKEKEAESDDEDDPSQQRTPAERLQSILPRTFVEVDEQCMAEDKLSGSTAVVAILTETDIVVANVGDSRGILYRSNDTVSPLSSSNDSDSDLSLDSSPSEEEITDDNDTDNDTDTDEELTELDCHKGKSGRRKQAEVSNTAGKQKKGKKPKKKPEEGPVGKLGRWHALSVDHKPNRPDERERLERTGGRVTQRPNDVWRFQSVLAVSRAFGDHGLKSSPGGTGLIAIPEIKVFPRQDNDQFLVLASDGLWDVFSNEQAARVARNVLLQNPAKPAQEMASALANGAYNKESLDNITALVVLLDELNDSSAGSSSPVLDSRSRHSEL